MKPSTLKQLLKNIPYRHIGGLSPSETVVQSVSLDSRTMESKGLYVAVVGERVDGHLFIPQVLESGCAAVLVEEDKVEPAWLNSDKVKSGVCVVAVASTREIYGEICASYYGYPHKRLKLVGITGTNGKTTITYLLEKILTDQGVRVGIIGTVNYRFIDGAGILHKYDAPFTTPEPYILQEMLFQMVEAGVELVLMEVSSHALSQRRLGNILFDVAAFTNLSHDHLDYHRDMDAYFAAKSRLFLHHLKPEAGAVVTKSSVCGDSKAKWAESLVKMLSALPIDTICVGKEDGDLIRLVQVKSGLRHTEIELDCPQGRLFLTTPLVGGFNVENILTVLGISHGCGIDLRKAAVSLGEAHGAPGRLERIEVADKKDTAPAIFVDYAHTPDALYNVLSTLKQLPHGNLFCVFGCGGDRDAAKRPEMGRIAASLVDCAIVTDDNPRSEDPRGIRDQITRGVIDGAMAVYDEAWLGEDVREKGCVVIGARDRAIEMAVWAAQSDDIVVIAGKGHETYQLTREGKRFFDDRLAAREAMLAWDQYSVADALGVETPNCQVRRIFAGISTDSRTVAENELFVALKGDQFDGHDYVDRALEKKAAGLVVSQDVSSQVAAKTLVFEVDDTLAALGDLAGYRRRQIGACTGIPVIGITGSCGKTTVKEMTAAIFEKRWPDSDKAPKGQVLKTTGNFNNLIGLPLSLLPLQLKHKAAVVEMGMNRPGEIARLTEVANPDICCIVNVRGAHLEGLGSLENVAKAKKELFDNSSRHSCLIVNLDDPHLRESRHYYKRKTVSFSENGKSGGIADVWATEVDGLQGGLLAFSLHVGSEVCPVRLQVPGRHNVSNALAAAAIATAAGIEIATIAAGLAEFTAADKRLEVIRMSHGPQLLNDTYNANPASMEAGILTLMSMNADVTVAIIGDMLELGESSKSAHYDLGKFAAGQGVDYLLVVGAFAEYSRRGALSTGLSDGRVLLFADKNEIAERVRQLYAEGHISDASWILIKASRAMRLESVVAQIVDCGSWRREASS